MQGDGCVDEERASAYVRGVLSDDEAAQIDAHAERCSDCRRFLSELTRTIGSLRAAPTGSLGPDEGAAATLHLARGAVVGRYVVLDRIGVGGMGVVYAAFDPELDRRVALKLLRKLTASAAVARLRLLREAQTLARLSHPNVVTVHDLGAFCDQIFVAMELVDGWTLRSWVSERAPTVAEVLRAFLAAGRGLAAAHAAGIVHRDFKPENVLVGRDGRIRVTDFGLAREVAAPADAAAPAPTTEPAAPAAALTATGSVLGTPRYMAPEQRAGAPADARSDQYSYCVALWEALYGTLLTDDPAATGDPIPTAKGPPAPAHVRRVLVRGLDEDPAARWPGMDALLAALARDPRRLRRRALATAGGAALLTAAVLLPRHFEAQRSRLCRAGDAQFAAVWNPDAQSRARRAILASGRTYAGDAWTAFGAALEQYRGAWTAMHREACEATRVAGHQTEEVLGLRMTCLTSCLDEAAALVDLVARNETPVESVALAARALPPVAGCADVVGLSAPLRPPADATVRARVETLRHELAAVRARYDAGRPDEALALVQPISDGAAKLDYSPLIAESSLERARIQDTLGMRQESEESYYQAAYAAEAGRHDDVAAAAWIRLTGQVGYDAGHPAEGRRLQRQAEAALARLRGRRRDLQAMLFRARAMVAQREGNFVLAEEEARRYLQLTEQVFGAESKEVARALVEHAGALRILHRSDSVLGDSQRALAINQRLFGPDHPALAAQHASLGLAYLDLLRLPKAIAEMRRAIAIVEPLGPDRAELGEYQAELGTALGYADDYAGAQAALERAIAIFEKSLGPDHPDVAEAHGDLSEALARGQRWPGALTHAQRALAIYEKSADPKAPPAVTLAGYLTYVGSAHLGLGHAREALGWFERALRVEAAAHGSELESAAPRFGLARALWATGGDHARARSLAEEAARALEGVVDPAAPYLRRAVADWLAQHR
jgi:tetratricopeptide (TPR) repeat protein